MTVVDQITGEIVELDAAGWQSPTEIATLLDEREPKVAGEIAASLLDEAVRNAGYATAHVYLDAADLVTRVTTKAVES